MLIYTATDLYTLPKGGTYRLVNTDGDSNFIVIDRGSFHVIPFVHTMFVLNEQPADCPAYDYLRRVEAQFGPVDAEEYIDEEIEDPEDLSGALLNLSYLTMRKNGYAYILTSENKIVKTRNRIQFHLKQCANFTPLMMCAHNLFCYKSLFGEQGIRAEENLKREDEFFCIRVRCTNEQLLDTREDCYALSIRERCWLIEDKRGRRMWLDTNAFRLMKDKGVKENLDEIAQEILGTLPPALYKDFEGSDVKKALLASKKFIGC